MTATEASSRRRFLAPEVVQTSAMDCGPATLKCLLEGYGTAVSYGRLREACQTDVDGTSIDTMETVANQLGLEAAGPLGASDGSSDRPALADVPPVPRGAIHSSDPSAGGELAGVGGIGGVSGGDAPAT